VLYLDTQQIIDLISNSPKKTIIKAFISKRIHSVTGDVKLLSEGTLLIGNGKDVLLSLAENNLLPSDYHIEMDHLNSAIALADYSKYNCRIEPGAVIRDMVEIGDNAIIMFGASINIGTKIGANTMIDMNAVLGGRVEVGANCHIGAGAVLAGVIEPASATPVIIEDNVLIGANAVVLEGVRIGKGSVVGAGTIVVKDVPPYSVVVGSPGRVIKTIDDQTLAKTELIQTLRNLN
jgi:tetrahydrodipicolinate N-acetyltransferase